VSGFAMLRFLSFSWRDLIEIGVAAVVIYRLLLLFEGTRALQMMVGIMVLVLAYAAAWIFKLTMITYLFGIVFTYGAFAALVLFQPELRAALAHLGQSRAMRMLRRRATTQVASQVADAVGRLAGSGTGALIAVERGVRLGDYALTGTPVLARVSADLLETIFTPRSPLHDGAVIIRGDTIIGAGCILPLTQNDPDDRTLGTRHRAALGLSEETDALAIIVSEETRQVSVAEHGRLRRGVTPDELRGLVSGVTPRATAEQAAVSLRA
jgi:diadenylate cyclase